uniref:NADH-ubiquinone oxidoreductase chain 6 n=1 Tax=Onthophagus sp. BMNH670919 TaxID=1848553 RepID=A0A1X9HDG3_9SCAR|nr:NADH deshydrogenase subunit 6 [Onthophagus sp. BMNH670919]
MMIMMILLFSLLMIWTKHPLSMGLILLIQTINLSLYMGYLNSNYWYSYILFLIMIGGMLVLFIYMTSVASNEKFYPSIKLFMFTMSMLFFYMFIKMMINPYYFLINSNFNEYQQMNINLSLNKYFNLPNSIIMYLLITYLLITLLVIVKITSFKKGSLRTYFSN